VERVFIHAQITSGLGNGLLRLHGQFHGVVYDLFREFSALASTRGLLFGSFSHAHHIPQHVAAGRTL
jgi:hypothetical protein